TAAGGLIGGGSDDGGGLDRATSTVVAGQRPDIYYIILDGYTGNDVLRETFEFDNGSFTEYLRGRGFHVANKSRSNYCQTILSLASSLNFTYLDEIAAELGESSSDRKPLIRMIRDSRARRFLKSKGYDFAAYSSGYNATEITAADIYIAQSGSMSEFEGILLNMTPVPVVMRKMNSRQMHRER
ncbi:MAG: hypothetical protein GY841_22545, partial [FCB group bacterium]|nr:hypothetical protein [FCB group bacterium]